MRIQVSFKNKVIYGPFPEFTYNMYKQIKEMYFKHPGLSSENPFMFREEHRLVGNKFEDMKIKMVAILDRRWKYVFREDLREPPIQ